MSAVLDLGRLKRLRRGLVIPGLDTDHYGTGAVDEGGLMPRRTMEMGTGEGDPLATLPTAALRPRRVFSAPTFSDEPPAPPELVTGNTVGVVEPELDFGLQPPPVPQKRIGLVGMDADPATAGMGTRPRVANPLEYRRQRVEEMEVEPKAVDRNGRLKSFGLGALRGALRGLAVGGLGGAIGGAAAGGIHGGFSPALDERDAQSRNLETERASYGRLLGARKAQTALEGDELSNRVKEAQIPYLLARPGFEERKLDMKGDYDAWRMSSGDRKQDSAENYITWRMANGDRRATTAEGLADLRREWVREIQPRQFERRQGETERHNVVNEALGGERVRQGAQRVEQGAARLEGGGAGESKAATAQQKRIDDLTGKAVTALAEAESYERNGDKASADLLRARAGAYRKQAEELSRRPAPRAARPAPAPRTPPVAEEDFVSAARQRLGAAFDEGKARAAYRQRYGR